MSCSGERRVMKLKDKEREKERARERELERETANDNPPKEIIEHFSHPHPLTYTDTDYAGFCCSTCTRSGHGKQCHSAECKFDLHRTCAESPLTWLWHIPTDNIEPFGSHQSEVINTTFAHPEHPVTAEFKKQSFRCDHCNNPGKGLSFVCHTCNVEFHQVCAKNPTRLNTYLHQHELELKLRPYFKRCALCGTEGSKDNRMYRCKGCRFYVHPGCSEWPLYLVHHPLHPDHPLMFKPCNWVVHHCSACKIEMDGYKYSCRACNVDFDPGCVWIKSPKLSVDEEVRQKYAGQQIRELPTTNLSLDDNLSENHASIGPCLDVAAPLEAFSMLAVFI